MSLEHCANSLRVVTYSYDDSLMHSLKIQFTDIMRQRKPNYFRGVDVKVNSGHDILALVCCEMTICCEKPTANLKHCCPEIFHHQKSRTPT